MEKGKYIVETKPVSYLDMSTLKSGDGFEGNIIFVAADGTKERAASTGVFRLEGSAKRKATGIRLRYSGYYSRTGKRWEVEQREKREAEKEKKRRENRINTVVKLWEEMNYDDQNAAGARMNPKPSPEVVAAQKERDLIAPLPAINLTVKG